MQASIKTVLSLFLCFSLFFGNGRPSYARQQDSAAAATAPIKLRMPDQKKLEALKNDSDFNYFEEVKTDNTRWQGFLYKVKQWLKDFFYQRQASGFWEFLMYVALVGVIGFVIIKMLKMDMRMLFGKKSSSVEIPYDIVEENIHELDLESLLENAITQHEYRKATRLLYLQSLKKLTEAELINWKPGKTNRSYISEVKQPVVRHEFEQLTNMFEYVWYGGATLGDSLFAEAHKKFGQFHILLKEHK
ncbi:hypothetical protein DP923_05670 [Pontibacter arcticus]|uniref:Protein-glutamine gamma-glutamyltransferase-like C-terminal domain-containing protein n=2 Tax=Pontibacter arcticus TaxID=2080288 RepID=A0A364REP1_9BACT|nr:hypothetical protein DP923_05670 [Pontibacter arcticus]